MMPAAIRVGRLHTILSARLTNTWFRIFAADIMSNAMNVEHILPGPVLLFGSGETSPSGRKLFDYVLRNLNPTPRLALLETPAGFELNSAQVIGRVAEFLRLRLQNYQPQVEIIPARANGTYFSPNNPEILRPMLEADLLFMGPGSPSYAVRQLRKVWPGRCYLLGTDWEQP